MHATITKDECGTDPTAILTFNSVNSSLKHMYLSTDPLYPLYLLLVLLTSLLISNVVRSDPEMLGIPRYNEHFGCFSANSL